MLLNTRLPFFAGAACALAAVLFSPRVQAADTLNWGTSGYNYSTAPNTVGTVNGNAITIQYSTPSYFNNSYVTANATTTQPTPAVGTNTANTTLYTDGGTNTGSVGTGSQALQILANFDNGTVLAANAGITITVFFSKPVSGLLFSFWDVDTNASGGNAYNDRINFLTGRTTAGTFVAPSPISSGAANTFSTGTFASNVNGGGGYGVITSSANAVQGYNANIAAGSLAAGAGTTTIQFAQTITQFSFTYQDTNVGTTDGTTTHSNIQLFALSNLQFTTVPEPSTWAMVGVAGIAGAWALRRRARRTA